MTSEAKKDYARRITTATQGMLTVIVYDMMLDYLRDARDGLQAQDHMAFRDALRKVRGCVSSCMNTLQMEYELAGNLMQLYIYISKELAKAEVKQEAVFLDHVEQVVVPLRNAFEAIKGQSDQDSIMGNTQEVYAGLTYERGQLKEEVIQQPQRGYFA